MNVWISQSIDFLSSVASFLSSPPIIYLVGLTLLIVIAKFFKGLVGG